MDSSHKLTTAGSNIAKYSILFYDAKCYYLAQNDLLVLYYVGISFLVVNMLVATTCGKGAPEMMMTQ